MKLLLVISCLTACLAAVSCAMCSGADDCKDGYCCIFITTRGMEKKGICRSHGRLGAKCNKEDAKFDYYGGKFMRTCPCKDGMVCEPTGLRPGVTDPTKIRNAQRCQKPVTTRPPIVSPATTVEPKTTQTKSEPKTEPVTEPKTESVTEPKTESVTEPKTESVTETNPEEVS